VLLAFPNDRTSRSSTWRRGLDAVLSARPSCARSNSTARPDEPEEVVDRPDGQSGTERRDTTHRRAGHATGNTASCIR
jgi:hypothetical protein